MQQEGLRCSIAPNGSDAGEHIRNQSMDYAEGALRGYPMLKITDGPAWFNTTKTAIMLKPKGFFSFAKKEELLWTMTRCKL